MGLLKGLLKRTTAARERRLSQPTPLQPISLAQAYYNHALRCYTENRLDDTEEALKEAAMGFKIEKNRVGLLSCRYLMAEVDRCCWRSERAAEEFAAVAQGYLSLQHKDSRLNYAQAIYSLGITSWHLSDHRMAKACWTTASQCFTDFFRVSGRGAEGAMSCEKELGQMALEYEHDYVAAVEHLQAALSWAPLSKSCPRVINHAREMLKEASERLENPFRDPESKETNETGSITC